MSSGFKGSHSQKSTQIIRSEFRGNDVTVLCFDNRMVIKSVTTGDRVNLLPLANYILPPPGVKHYLPHKE